MTIWAVHCIHGSCSHEFEVVELFHKREDAEACADQCRAEQEAFNATSHPGSTKYAMPFEVVAWEVK